LSNKKFPSKVISPGATIGIVGGGQLARMTAIAAAELGYKVHVYSSEKDSPAFHVCAARTVAEYSDKQALAMFAGQVDVVTYEFENIPADTLEELAKFVPVRPAPETNRICQNRLAEKRFINSVGVSTTKFESIESLQQLSSAIEKIGYPAVLKSNMGGYDGKGQVKIDKHEDLEKAWRRMEQIGSKTSILEAFVSFEMEISIIIARGIDGKLRMYPAAENKHENHILKESTIPANISDKVLHAAQEAANKIAIGIELVGVLAVEMFVTKDQQIVVNELAPRPHNSGHWGIEGCSTSQFEQLVRCVCCLPLGSTKPLAQKIVMTNLLGAEANSWADILQDENAHLHLYGKSEVREGRKMGHVTKLF